MVLKCYQLNHEKLVEKGIYAVIDCPIAGYRFKNTGDLRWIVESLVKKLGLLGVIVFSSSEAIGTTHVLYRYHVQLDDDYIGVRVVTKNNNVYRILLTIPRREYLPNIDLEKYDPYRDMKKLSRMDRAPGQYTIPNLVVYAILGFPKEIDLSKWVLEINGLVENPTKLHLSDLYGLGLKTINTSFHCVTGWSVKDIEFTGVPIDHLLEHVKPRESVKWVYAEGLDGYSSIIPYDELIYGESIIALEMNRRPLDPEHGYPARLIIPHLYGWKSVKWLNRITFMEEYRDGYWEALGYHPRGRVDLEERFKKS